MSLTNDNNEPPKEFDNTLNLKSKDNPHPPYNPIDRLEQQIFWYDKKSISAHFKFKTLKLMQTMTSALTPVASAIDNPDLNKTPALLDLVSLNTEGIQQLNQYQQVWTTYRLTYEALKHEKYTYLTSAGPYARVDAPEALLADRI